jgi:hypothetical protein
MKQVAVRVKPSVIIMGGLQNLLEHRDEIITGGKNIQQQASSDVQ